MKPRSWTLVLGMLGLAAMLAAKVSAQKDEPATPEGVEVLARGPVHEGFAVPFQTRPLPSHIVPNKPPDPINEVPPDEKPAGDHVTVASRLLGLGRRTKELPVGERLLACAASGSAVGAGQLATGRGRLAVDFRFLGGRGPARDDLSARAASVR